MQDKPGFEERTPGKEGADIGQDAREELRKGAEQVSDEAKGRAESIKSQATDQAQRTASALGSAAEEFESQGQETLARMLADLSRNLADLAKRVEHKSLDELVREGGRLAERNPLLFVAGSVAAGAMLSRFFKAHDTSGGMRRDYGQSRSAYDDRASAYGGDSAYGSDTTATYGGATPGTTHGASAYGRADRPLTGDGGER
jgi:hypothetical protein